MFNQLNLSHVDYSQVPHLKIIEENRMYLSSLECLSQVSEYLAKERSIINEIFNAKKVCEKNLKLSIYFLNPL